MSKYAISLIFLLYTFTYSLTAQEYVFDYEYISVDDGLPDKEVFDILQEEDGYLWISTPGAISRFDGYSFKNKTYTDSILQIGSKSAVKLAFDQKGNLWYHEQGGPSPFCGIINTKTDSIYSLSDYTKGALNSVNITAITTSKVSKGTILISTQKGSVYQFDQSLKKIYQNELPLSFLSSHELADGSFWILDEGLAIHYKPNQPDTFRSTLLFQPLKLVSQTPEVIIEIEEMPVSYVKLQVLSGKEVFSPLTPTIKGVKEPIKLSTAGNYQLQYTPHLLQFSYKGAKLSSEAKNLIRPCDNCRLVIHCAFTDVQDNLWLGTKEGIIKFTPIKKDYNLLEKGKSIKSIFQWGDTLWVGELTRNVRLDLATSRKQTFLKKERVIATAFAKDNQGLLWTAANNKIIRFDREGNRVKTESLKGNYAKAIHFNPSTSQLLIGSSLGIEVFDTTADTFKISKSPIDSTQIDIRQIYQNEEGIGVVTDSGLFVLDPVSLEQNQHYSSITTSLPTDDLFYAYPDGDFIWIATNKKGLLKWNAATNTYKTITTANGLSSNTLYAIYEDTYNNLWLPSKGGLNCFNKKTNKNHIYNESDNIQFKPFAHYQSPQGTMYFGGDNGIIKRHPDDLFLKDTTSHPFHLVKILVLPTSSDQYEDRTNSVFSNREIVISPYDKVTEIHYNLMDFRNLYGKEYEYRIEGYQDNWLQTRENKIRLINPPYGQYSLQIKAKGTSQIIEFPINAESSILPRQLIEMPIIVQAPIYEQLWFQLLILALSAIGVYLLSRLRIRALERDKERLEAEVLKRTRKIEEDHETITAQAEELKALDKAKTRFFSNITHEYRTPLTLIMGRTNQLLETSTDSSDDRKLNSILGSANNLLGLVNQLLDLSKLEGKKMKIEVYHGDLIGYTEELVYRFKQLATQKNIELVQTSKRKVWKTYFDKNMWDRIVINLLSNAIKFTPEGGSVKVHIKSTKKEEQTIISLEVKDTGMGIAKEQLDRIFKRFHQVDGSSTKIQQGTGIGLSLVKELVDLQKGELEVSSEVNKGTSFMVHLPILAATENAKKLVLSSAIIPMLLDTTSSTSKAKKKKNFLDLLIIEDNHDMRNYISQCIDPTKYNILEATNGEEGIQMALDFIPDLIISDVMMPKKNGFEVVQTLRADLSTSHIPIVLLTAKASLSSKIEGLEKGADAYLTKPFSPNELVVRVNKLIELRQQLQSRYNTVQLTPTHTENTTDSYGQEDEFVASVKEYILSHIEDTQLNGDSIGSNFGMSRMQLHRKLKALTNLPVGDIIRNLRIEKAAQLLIEHKMNISEIAYTTGFSSPSTFSRIFKDKKGASPTEFRAKNTSSV